MSKALLSISILLFILSCTKKEEISAPQNSGFDKLATSSFYLATLKVDNQTGYFNYYHISRNAAMRIYFSKKVDSTTVPANVQLKENTTIIPVNYFYENNDSVIVMIPKSPLKFITKYAININANLQSRQHDLLGVSYAYNQVTTIDSTDKFPRISDAKLLNLVEKNSFNYFWLWANPISGMAKERFTSGDIVTTGGTGFAIMGIPAAIKRNFITRADGLARLTKIVNFLDLNAQKYHGAFAHWINGNSGTTIPFSTFDNGADLVETSYLMEGLLTARQFFNGSAAEEVSVRATINKLWQNVEWDWFTQGGQNVLYWHWSPNYGWAMNFQIRGWNEAMITYVLAASSPTHPISTAVYSNGWARNGAIKNGNTYYGVTLPLGPSNGGPMFFEHYSFLGINPNGLKDAYANYAQQTKAHTAINYNYCVANPKRYNGYSDSCWGLTASDNNISGYSAHEPNNDLGIIAPTAAVSSLPYTPVQSMAAIRFFYYKLGDKLWNSYYGFKDAFNLTNPWFDSDYLAIDQMPMVVMIENFRSNQIWNLFTSCPEVKTGMRNIGFTAPYL